ncbi:hypothetical protein [Streptomyces subrutilus]|uniref:Uncharacterized protein n=1 Tax=Streptomyces subrutilus TaxID=36818 RepID=A0A1E5PZ64_9ACTN|nr:hypothetical protein [Streptomyces subrutilus]OEJ34801.1 hypothetical protein BGK67_28780 [Streptomyces subrutilus]
MSRQWWGGRTAAAGVLAGGIAITGVAPAWADAEMAATAPSSVSIAPSASSAVPGVQAEQTPSPELAAAIEEARRRVTSMAKTHPAAEVRTSAWNALRSSRGDEALLEWLAPGGGFDYAKQRARDTRARNKAFCERVVATHTVGFSPEVRAAAARALKGSVAEQAAFVRTGYADAQQRNRAAREATEQQRLEVAARDRDFVRTLGERDPGEQVRVAAQWALRPGATTDTDVAEFFGYGWATGAALDLEAYRTRVADGETVRHHTLTLLIREAAAAEAAVKDAADAAQARAAAERAWKAVSEHADAAQRAWLAEQAAAAAQAENWRAVALLSQQSAEELWKAISGTAETSRGAWAGEQAGAVDAAAFWKAMFERAQDGESRVRG